MPDNSACGMLETLLFRLIDPALPLFQRVNAFLDAIPEVERLFPEVRRDKALIHTWLAVQTVPGKPLGQALTARYLDPSHPNADAFVDWLRRLFGC